jgi:hypothetical protein
LEEESAVISKNEKHRGPYINSKGMTCINCNKYDHVASKCYLKSKRDVSVHQFSVKNEVQGSSSDIICFNCNRRGYMARDCRKDRKSTQVTFTGKPESSFSGNEFGPSGNVSRPTVQFTPSFLRVKVNIGKEGELLVLIDTGAGISLLKGANLIGSTEYDPEGKVRVKSVKGSWIETRGKLSATIELMNSSITHEFQLVKKQVDISYHGVLGRDFFQNTKAVICYGTQSVLLNGETLKISANQTKVVSPSHTREPKKIKSRGRSESVVKLPVKEASPLIGIVDKQETQEGIFLAGFLTKVANDHVITSISNTKESETEIEEPIVELYEVDPTLHVNYAGKSKQKDREQNILEQLRLEHLHSKERKLLVGACLELYLLPTR